MRAPGPTLMILAALPLAGCAPVLAAKAVGAAVRAADGPERVPGEDPGPAARQACSAEAEARGGTAVRIIDTEYRSAARLVVWGTAEIGGQRRSFECRFEGKVAGFKLRAI